MQYKTSSVDEMLAESVRSWRHGQDVVWTSTSDVDRGTGTSRERASPSGQTTISD